MDQSTITQIQKNFIRKKLRFNVTERYFGEISSNDLSNSYRNIRFRDDCQGVDLYINNSNDANIAKSLKKYMSFNPLRWQEIYNLDFSYESVIDSIDNELWYNDVLGNKLYDALNDIYTKGILRRNMIEITMDKGKEAYKNYWVLRNMFNVFKKICETNLKDFRTAKYRDSIIITMSEKFPEQVNPKNFGLIQVLDEQPADLFTKWHWERQRKRSGK